MPDKSRRSADQQQPQKGAESASGELVGDSKAPLVKGTESQEVQNQPRYQDEPPERPFFRWLWKYAQVILSALTLAVLAVTAAQWWQARETREIENRAYVVVKSVSFRPQSANPGISDIVVTITNTGKTPGLNGKTFMQTEPRENPIPDDAGFPPLDSPPSRTVFAPQIDFEITGGSAQNLAGEQMELAAREQAAGQSKKTNPSVTPTQTPQPILTPAVQAPKFNYVYGLIEYDDVFGRKHQTKFCYFNTPRTPNWNSCTTYNSFN